MPILTEEYTFTLKEPRNLVMRNKKDTWENQRERKTTKSDKLYGKDT